MAQDTPLERYKAGDQEEAAGLLQDHVLESEREQPQSQAQTSREGSPDENSVDSTAASNRSGSVGPGKPPPPKRQSSLAQQRPDGPPKTPRRVRFEVAEPPNPLSAANGDVHAAHPEDDWIGAEDFLNDSNDSGDDGGPPTSSPSSRQAGHGQRVPLLTDIRAPSITLATELDFNPADHLETARPKSGLRSAFMNMANSIIGAGIIGQPYAFKQAGLLTGIILLVGLTITVDWTIRLIVTNSKMSGANSFQATMEHCYGKSGLVAISIAQWAFAFGGMVAFCIIIGDTIPHVVVAVFPALHNVPVLWLLTDRRAIIVLFVLGVSYPLSLYRDIAMLAKASALALISMIVIILTVLTQGPLQRHTLHGALGNENSTTSTRSLIINDGVFQAIGVISFAFVCHHNSLLIYGSLRTPTLDRFATVTHFSTGISMLACLAMALGGYLSFGDETKGNVLNNFPRDNVVVNIARLCFGLNMLTTLPLECFVCREVMTEYYFPREAFHPNRHLIFTTSLIVSAMTLSLLTCDLGIVFELVGATSACALAYILPPLCFVKLSKKGFWEWEILAAWACIGFGAAVMGVSLVLAGLKLGGRQGAGVGGTF